MYIVCNELRCRSNYQLKIYIIKPETTIIENTTVNAKNIRKFAYLLSCVGWVGLFWNQIINYYIINNIRYRTVPC